MPARTIHIILHNTTGFSLTKFEDDLDHGAYTGTWTPPQSIGPNSNAEWRSESDGILTGTEGRVRYKIENGTNASLFFHWDIPYEGSNNYNESIDNNFDIHHTGGDGEEPIVDLYASSSVPHYVPNFKPSVNGLKFVNRWNNDTPYSLPPLRGSILDFKYGNAKNGLCGGMVYTVRDYFDIGLPIPPTTTPPLGEQDPLFVYIVNRLFDTFDIDDVTLAIKLMDPAYPDTDENLLNPVGLANGRAFVMAKIEWPMIRQDIDAGHPSPIWLSTVKSLDITQIGCNHQILVYGYQQNGTDVTLWVYDPNQPGIDNVYLKFNISTTAERIDVSHNVGIPDPIYCFFRTNYSFKHPIPAWRPWFNIHPETVFNQTSPVVISRNPDQLDIFKIGYNNAVWSTFWNPGNGWSAWFQIHPETVFDNQKGHITAVSRNPNQIDLFTTGFDNAVWSTYWVPANGWNAWFKIHPETVFNQQTPVTVISRNPDQLDLFKIGFDKAVWSTYWTAANGWNAWFQIHPETLFDVNGTVSAISRNPGQIDLFVTGFDGAVWTTYWTSATGWNAWYQIHPETVFNQQTPVTVVSRNPDQIDLFRIGFDGAVWTSYWTAATGWVPWFQIHQETKFNANGTVTVVSRNVNQIDLYVTGLDGAVWSAFWNTTVGWHEWFQVYPQTVFNQLTPVACISRTPHQVDLFRIGFDNALWTTFWNE